MTLCNGVGETFTGIGALGVRKRFRYGESFTVRLRDGNVWIGGERMHELFICGPNGDSVGICKGWPNKVKPYLAALLRHPNVPLPQSV